jgi:hypothetical protein
VTILVALIAFVSFTAPQGATLRVVVEDQSKRVRLEVFAGASNLVNVVNPIGYSGVMTSPFFLQPTAAMAARKIDLGLKIGF